MTQHTDSDRDDAAEERARRLRAALDDATRIDVTRDEIAPTGQVHQTRTDDDYLAERPPHHG